MNRVYSPVIPKHRGRYIYRLWASDGGCLYVGRVGEIDPRFLYMRFAEHRKTKPWWPQVTRIDVLEVSGRDELFDEERVQIQELQPVYNKALLAACSRGHESGRDSRGNCRECARLYNLKKSLLRGGGTVRRPSPGQAALW